MSQARGNGHASRQQATDPKQNEAEHFALEIARTLNMAEDRTNTSV